MSVTGIGQCSFDYLAVVDSFPEIDTKKETSVWEGQGGGPVATALVALSRFGIPCSFHGIIGADPEGEKIRQSLAHEGIDIGGLLKREDSSSQVAFIAIEEESGKRTIFWRRPTGHELGPSELGPQFLSNSKFLLLDGLMKDVSLYSAGIARRLGVPVMLDAGRLREGMIDIAVMCDYVVASEEFARGLGWNDNPESFRREIVVLGKGVITVTLGEKGSITFAGGEYFYSPAFKVEVKDTTGAGDVFHGGYIYGLLQGWNIRDTIRFASAAAALKCRKIGGRAGIPGLQEVLRLIER